MLLLREIIQVKQLERFRLIGRETPENEGEEFRLLNQACEVVFGAPFASLPAWFFEEDEPWGDPIEHRSWAAKRGYDLNDEFGRLLNCADEMGYMIEAIERGVIAPDQELITQHKEQTWARALQEEARRFAKRVR